MLNTRHRDRSRYMQLNLGYILDSLSFVNDLYIFRPQDAVIINDKISEIPDYNGSSAKFEQTVESYRPTLSNDNTIDLGLSNTDIKGFVSNEPLTFREIFIVTSYDVNNDDVLETEFSNFPTLWSGTEENTGGKRIAGDGRVAAEDDLLTNASVHATGKVRLGLNQTEVNLDIVPLPLTVVSTAVNDFDVVLEETDTVTLGYNSQFTTRSWTGPIGTIVVSKVALLNSQRIELITALNKVHNII